MPLDLHTLAGRVRQLEEQAAELPPEARDGRDGRHGTDGAPGRDGQKGEIGLRGYPGQKGDKGDSVSAYEVARANGFHGTQAAWLDSLKGRPGDKGDPGIAAVLPPVPTKWKGEVFRDDRDRLAGAALIANTGAQWQAAFHRDQNDLIDEFVLNRTN